MNDYLSRLVQKHDDRQVSLMQPRIASRYEQPQNFISAIGDDAPVSDANPTYEAPLTGSSTESSTPFTQGESLSRASDDSRNKAIVRSVPDGDLLDRLALAERMLRNLQPGRRPASEPSTSTGTSSVPQTVIDSVPQNASSTDLHQHFHLHDDRVTNIRQNDDSDQHKDVPLIAATEQLGMTGSTDAQPFSNSSGAGRNAVPHISLQSERPYSGHETRNSAAPTISAEPESRGTETGATIQVAIGRIEIRSPHKGSAGKAASPPSSPSSRPESKIMTLDDYARMRRGGYR